MNQLQRFIEDYLKRTDISRRKLALMMGMADTTIGDYMNKKGDTPPSVEFLVNLAVATKTDIRDLIVMVSPDNVILGSQSETASLAARISKLPEDERKLIDRFISGALSDLAKNNDEA